MQKSKFMDAWSVSKSDFPHDGSAQEKLAFCVRYAILAPSPFNTQPWFFEIKGDTLTVYADRRYCLPVSDPDDRGLIIAASAALYNLRLAIRNFGYEEITEYLPNAERESILARVKIGKKSEVSVTPESHKRFEALTSFEFDHSAFSDKAVSQEDVQALKDAVVQERAWLYICDRDCKPEIMNMIAEADQTQTMNKNFRREFASWTDWRRKLGGDGLPQYAKSFSKSMNTFTPSEVRRFKGGEGDVATDDEFTNGVPLLAILGSVTGGMVERILTGQALMRLCLTAASRGLSVSTLNQVCEIPELRLRLHDEINQQGRAHVILRIGHSNGKPELNIRRPLSSVLIVDDQPYHDDMFAGESGKKQKMSSKRSFLNKFSKVFLAKKAS